MSGQDQYRVFFRKDLEKEIHVQGISNQTQLDAFLHTLARSQCSYIPYTYDEKTELWTELSDRIYFAFSVNIGVSREYPIFYHSSEEIINAI